MSDRLDGIFGALSVRKRVVASQLPVTLTVVLVVIAAAIFSPETLTDNLFLAALLFHLLILGACVAFPWGRLPGPAFAVIPVLDCLAIGFTREAGGSAFNVLSLMLVFPVIWLSAQVRPFMAALAIAGTVLSTVAPSAALGSPPGGGVDDPHPHPAPGHVRYCGDRARGGHHHPPASPPAGRKRT
ncbi:hypothetical protein ACFFGR_13275 [Arthrobacter liuii]|uniref:Uncharacterized protein n=1 Tax=Arthrobacter liuii TaxID=1476996 RepID=A0ABQ2AVP4_9MICC|nr:hypothetical protein [Arthrobacter liuii]GGH99247.1 hypothetical protein GCM10007170_33650 [Arthrobacter liuii]